MDVDITLVTVAPPALRVFVPSMLSICQDTLSSSSCRRPGCRGLRAEPHPFPQMGLGRGNEGMGCLQQSPLMHQPLYWALAHQGCVCTPPSPAGSFQLLLCIQAVPPAVQAHALTNCPSCLIARNCNHQVVIQNVMVKRGVLFLHRDNVAHLGGQVRDHRLHEMRSAVICTF